MESFVFENSKGLHLHSMAYLPPSGSHPFAALVFHHGYAEHVGRKAAVFQRLAAGGVAVIAYDAAGLGASEPLQGAGRAYINSYHDMVDDFLAFTRHAQAAYAPHLAGCPLYAAGYSIDAQYAALAAVEAPELFSGVVLVSPAAGVGMDLRSRVLNLVSVPLNALVPHARIVHRLNPHHLLSDPKEVQHYEEDVLVDHGAIRVGTAVQILKGAQDMQRFVGQLRVPVFVLHSRDDHVIPLKDVQVMAGKIIDGQGPLSDVTVWVVKGQGHDLLSDTGSLQHAATLTEWLAERS